MDMDKIKRIAAEAMKDRKSHSAREPGFILHHGRRVAGISAEINRQEKAGVEEQTLFVGALCHDIGKGEEPHQEVGARILARLLPGCDCSEGEVSAICDIVRSHNRRHGLGNCSTAARIVQDADVLDHAGTIGVWIAFHWAAENDQSVDDAIKFHHGEENARFHEALRSCLNFQSSRKALERRLMAQNQFFDDLERQHCGAIW